MVLENDSLLKLDSNLQYKVLYHTSYLFPGGGFDLPDAFYIDSKKLICDQRVEKSSELIKLNFLNLHDLHLDSLETNRPVNRKLKYSTYKKTKDLYPYDAEYSALISFDNGRYLIFCEMRFGPDIMSSMPPGKSVSFFLERTE